MNKVKSLILFVKRSARWLLFRKRRPVVSLKLTQLKNEEILWESKSVLQSLTYNADTYPAPPLSASLQAAICEMDAALLAFENNKDKRASLHYLSMARKKLRQQLQTVISYCLQVVSNGNELMIEGLMRKESRKVRK